MKLLVSFLSFFLIGFLFAHASWHEFDPKTRTERWILSENKEIEWVFDDCGNRITWKDWAGITRYDYNKLDKLEQVTTPSGEIKLYTFDSKGLLRKIGYPSKSEARYDYTLDNGLAEVAFCGRKIEYIYDPDSRLLMLKKLPGGITTEYKYDLARQLTDIIHRDAQKDLIAHFHFEYDFMGNRSVTKKISPTDEVITTYTYDKVYRLKEAISSDGFFEKYTYKPNGDRATKETPKEIISYTYEEGLFTAGAVTYHLDVNGNVSKKMGPSGVVEYTYNELNQLIEYKDHKKKVIFTYNGQGERLSKEVNGKTTFYSYDDVFPVFQVLEERNEDQTREYFYGLGPLGHKENGKIYYYLEASPENPIGMIIDESERIVKEQKYEAFGKPRVFSENLLQYAGEQYDPETGLIFLRTRYYDPELGRFLSPDQVLGKTYDPQSWNRYIYANNNPLKFVDPMGTVPVAPKDKIQPIFWSKGKPIWQKGDPLPPEGWTLVAICARYGGILQTNPLTKGTFRSLQEAGGHVWEEFINSKGEHSSCSISNDETLDPPNFCTTDAKDYIRDKGIVRLAYLVPDAVAENMIANVKKYSEGGYDLFLHNCVHATREGACAAGIEEPFYEAQWILEADESTLDYQPLMKPSKVHMNIEKKIQELKLKDHLDEVTLEEAVKNWKIAGELANTSTPSGNFGGISLSKQAEIHLDLKEIYGAVFDEGTQQLILVGKKSLKLPEMRLDDFAVATQSIYGLQGAQAEDPGISIEPCEEAGKEDQMQVKYFGKTYGTEFGRILFEGDLTLKKLSLGELSCHVKGFSPSIERERKGKCLRPNSLLSCRHWIEPERITLIESMDGSAIVFDEVRMRCLSETQRDGQKIASKESEAFAFHFSDNYEAIACEYPIFAEVKRLGQITAVVKWLKENQIPFDLAFFESYKPLETFTPLWIPQMCKHFIYANKLFWIKGGIHLNLQAIYKVRKELSIDRFKEEVMASRPNETTFSWNLDKDWVAEALPTNSRKTGDFQRAFIDVQFPAPGDFPLLLMRYYDSFREEDIGLGRGWAITPFDIKLGEKVALTEESGETLFLYRFLLVREGNQEWLYYPSQRLLDGTLWYLREDRQQKICIHPDQSFELFLKAGGHILFNKEGKLTRTIDRHKISIHFIYEKGLLRCISRENGKQITLKAKGGRITQVTSPSGMQLFYRFDHKQQLASVSDAKPRSLMKYGYDNNLRLSSIEDSKGNLVFEGSYDDYNRLSTIKIGMASMECRYDLAKHSSSLVIPDIGEIQRTFDKDYQFETMDGDLEDGWVREYNDRNLLKQLTDPSGAIWRFRYNSMGNILTMQNPKGEITGYVYDQDQKLLMKKEHVKYLVMDGTETNLLRCDTDPEYCTTYTYKMGRLESIEQGSSKTAFDYDENGVLKEIIKPSGYHLHRKVNEQFRIKKVWDAYGVIKEYEYAENYFAAISPLGRMEIYFDEQKRISHQIDCNGNITRFRYTPEGSLESIEDAEGFLHLVG